MIEMEDMFPLGTTVVIKHFGVDDPGKSVQRETICFGP